MFKKFAWGVIALMAMALTTTGAYASFHTGSVADGMSNLGPIGFALGSAYDFVAHIYAHAFITTMVVIENPMTALFVLDGIGEACFSASPPASHTLFANAGLAIISTIVTWALTLIALLRLFEEIVRRVSFGRKMAYT